MAGGGECARAWRGGRGSGHTASKSLPLCASSPPLFFFLRRDGNLDVRPSPRLERPRLEDISLNEVSPPKLITFFFFGVSS